MEKEQSPANKELANTTRWAVGIVIILIGQLATTVWYASQLAAQVNTNTAEINELKAGAVLYISREQLDDILLSRDNEIKTLRSTIDRNRIQARSMHQLIITQGNTNIDRYLAKLQARGHTYELVSDKVHWKNGEPDWTKLREFTSLLYASRRETIDTIKWFLKDWQLSNRTVGKIWYTRLPYPLQLVRIRPPDDETADHEDMHLFGWLCRVYGNFDLATLLQVEDFDEDVVHARDRRFTEYKYDEVWRTIELHVTQAIRIRKLRAQLPLLQQVAILYRELLDKQKETSVEGPIERLCLPVDLEHMRITQAFGVPNLRYPRTNHHTGIDIAAPEGSAVYAIANARITKVYDNDPILGNACEFEFTLDGVFYTARYLHLQFVPQIGAYKKGQFIGRVGNTGDSEGPHLHLDIVRGVFDLTNVNSGNWRDKFVDPTAIMERIPA